MRLILVYWARSTGMSPTKTRKTKTTKNPDAPTTEATTPAETPQDGGKQVETKPVKGDQVRKILSVNFPARTLRQLKLPMLASVDGVSIASIVVAAVTKTVAKRLPNALAEIAKADVDGE